MLKIKNAKIVNVKMLKNVKKFKKCLKVKEN